MAKRVTESIRQSTWEPTSRKYSDSDSVSKAAFRRIRADSSEVATTTTEPASGGCNAGRGAADTRLAAAPDSLDGTEGHRQGAIARKADHLTRDGRRPLHRDIEPSADLHGRHGTRHLDQQASQTGDA